MKVESFNKLFKDKMNKLSAILALSLITAITPSGDIQAQTAPAGGWIGMGKLSSVPFSSLAPTKCSYRLVRTGQTYSYFPGSVASTAIGYLPISGYDEATIPSVGKLSSVKFEVPLSRVGDFALAIVGEYPDGASFFIGDMNDMKMPSCQIIWSLAKKIKPTDTIVPGVKKPILKCSDLYFEHGQLPQESEISKSIELDPGKLSLQKENSCK